MLAILQKCVNTRTIVVTIADTSGPIFFPPLMIFVLNNQTSTMLYLFFLYLETVTFWNTHYKHHKFLKTYTHSQTIILMAISSSEPALTSYRRDVTSAKFFWQNDFPAANPTTSCLHLLTYSGWKRDDTLTLTFFLKIHRNTKKIAFAWSAHIS